MPEQVLGKRIRELREGRGLTRVQLGVYAGVSTATVSLAENGRRTPNAETLVKLADALGVEPGDLFKEPVPLAQAPPLPPEVSDEKRRDREESESLWVGTLATELEDFLSDIRSGRDAPGGVRDQALLIAYNLMLTALDNAQDCRQLGEEILRARDRAWSAMRSLDWLRLDYRDAGAASADLRTRRPQAPATSEEPGDATGATA
jgi:transcriptional regulator with XRE-family HTH domain